jgi:bacterioferritin-associated ferredoxin
MLVCHCHAVNDAAVEELVASGATRVGHVVRNTRAGTSCGGCLPELRRLCEHALATAATSSAAASAATTSRRTAPQPVPA